MTESRGRLVAHLAEPSEELPAGLIELINRRIRPPRTLQPDDVYVRAMYVVSDEVNSFGGCFTADEHARLAELLVDSPVMVGHRKDKLPVGRTFHAVTLERNGRPWVKSYFYWLRASADSEQLRENIDGGVYRECSVAFTFLLPECSICGQDIRQCRHEPFQTYRLDGALYQCHFNYRRLEKVLETSLVYRGAVPDTAVSRELGEPGANDDSAADGGPARSPLPLHDLRQLNRRRRYLLVPYYEVMPVTAEVAGGDLVLRDQAGNPLNSLSELGSSAHGLTTRGPVAGRLVGYRGKERCSRRQIERFLADRSGPVTRLVLNLFPSDAATVTTAPDSESAFAVRVIPHRWATVDDLARKGKEITTRLGIEIWPADDDGGSLAALHENGFWCHPDKLPRVGGDEWCLDECVAPVSAILSLRCFGHERVGATSEAVTRSFRLARFDRALLASRRRFVAEEIAAAQPGVVTGPNGTGPIKSLKLSGDCLVLDATGDLAGRFTLRPIRLGGQRRFLFYRLDREKDGKAVVNGDRASLVVNQSSNVPEGSQE